MAAKKKSRKVGLIGVRKDPDHKPGSHRNSDPRPKKRKGKPAGSRHNVDENKSGVSQKQGPKDPRLGSKKPIQLVKAPEESPNTVPQKRKYATPAQELAALEADQRLASLLDKLDEDKTLTKEQQAYVDEKMARHRILCDLLGIIEEEDEEDVDDPLDDLDAINISDFKD